MTDTLIGGILALAGVIIGGLTSFIIELWRNKNSISERKHQRKKEIADKRCDQAETFVQAMTDDFQSTMFSTKLLISSDEKFTVDYIAKVRNELMERKDFKVFSLGASILALSDDELTESYHVMLESFDELRVIRKQAVEAKLENKLGDPETIIKQIDNIWVKDSNSLGKFYSRIDIIRYKLSEE